MLIEPNELLLADRYSPITSSMGFFEAPCADVVKQFVRWQEEIREGDGLIRRLMKRISTRTVTGNLEQIIQTLLPLKTNIATRYLFIPTINGWTAYFDNGFRGTDPTVIAHLPDLMQTRSVWIVANPHKVVPGGGPTRNRPGCLLIAVHGHEKREWLNLIREIRLYNDVGRWHFEQAGQPFPFEQTARYEAKKKTDRFDFALLKQYLSMVGSLSPFETDFYLPAEHRKAVLVDIRMSYIKENRNVSLEEARRLNGIE